MSIEIAIPTYNRPHKLISTTLKLLEEVPNDIIKIYVENEEQYLIYQEHLTYDYEIIITNTQGIGEKRNWIKHHTTAKYLLQIDDDIYAIKDWNGISLSSERVYDLIKRGFEETEKAGLHLWGICCYANAFYMKNTITTNLKFICGGFHGTITDKIIDTPIDTFEDYWNTCSYFREDGGVLRLNGYGLKTKTFTEKGGLQSVYSSTERLLQEAENATKVKEEFKNMVSIIKKKRGIDLRLNYNYKVNSMILQLENNC